MVEAVPIVLQVPGERVDTPSISTMSRSPMWPARYSSQYLRVWVPAPTLVPRQRPFSIGPAGQKITGRSMLTAPMIRPGPVLSQPPIRTAPSIGCCRSSSSASMARRLRYSMVVGLTMTSPSDSAGSSTGKPPARSTPRFTASARSRRCAWQGDRSLQVLRIAITGRPMNSSRRSPICCIRCRWAKARMLSAVYQRALRRSSGRRVGTGAPPGGRRGKNARQYDTAFKLLSTRPFASIMQISLDNFGGYLFCEFA